ncbi:rubredoxin [Deferribacterales bacterium RsTz2092]
MDTADKYVCSLCGYVYSPDDNGGVAFEDLPADWVCPECGATKEVFEKIS